MSSTLRITGLATGLDVDTMVKQLMQAEKAKVDKAKQDKQIIQWTQDLYREIINDLTTFKNTYFDVLKSDKYILSANNLSGFDTTSVDSVSSTATPTATATAGAGAQAGVYSVVVNQIAKAATIEGGQINNNNLETVTLDTNGYITNNEWSTKTIRFNVDGTDIDIMLSDFGSNQVNLSGLANEINNKINSNTSLKGKISVTVDGTDKLKFNVLGSNQIKISSNGTNAAIDNIAKDKVLVPNKNTKLSDLKNFTADTTFTLNYNGTTQNITAAGTDTIDALITKINTATSGGVVAKYSELTGKFSIQTSNTGSNTSLSISTPLSFLGMNSTSTFYGQDAEVKITPPGGTEVTITKSTNNFTIDGITYSLQTADTARTTKITVSSNTQKVFDRIKEFVDKYNEIIDKVNNIK